jgi:hypothetical protein
LLAADTFSYGYEHYADHEGNLRFDKLMPNDVRIVDRANRESWDLSRLARKLEADVAAEMLDRFREAVTIVDAPHPGAKVCGGVAAPAL